jgi:hypothetical protein
MAHHYSGLDEAIELRMVCNAMQCNAVAYM